ncbi:uncharacterized protein K460DRAFT_91013 [Cucurbitaria berberidis CBS 394.84]|uniref:DNA2/NAM7 helicase helicase domain-containing protein n=1 Tax=Cucurbitaria berberidis CBS 394.84 TaxID=1168544 RepID=A0A9P4GQG3_9PLEO|nr:uncharacterized protein K460DRAFT_91013 [Cucurbitaria berberidis CBS 394.84]KAF1849444.1 hypothetical protein K460DRAFT_91013 [Cucurbitaria berberidis CBS 394.84]
MSASARQTPAPNNGEPSQGSGSQTAPPVSVGTDAMDVDNTTELPFRSAPPAPSNGELTPAQEGANEEGLTDEGVMEGISYQGRPVRKRLQDCSDALRKQILDRRPDLYQNPMKLSSGEDIDFGDIFELRSNDVPSHLPKWVRERSRQVCVLGFRDTATPDEAVFLVGASLLAEPKKVESEAQTQNQSKKGKDKGKGKANVDEAGPVKPKVAKDAVKASLHLDSQTPNIQLTTRKLGQEAGKSDILSTRIYGSDLAIGEDGKVIIQMRPTLEHIMAEAFEAPGYLESGNASMTEVNTLREEGRLVEISFLMEEKKQRVWTGLRSKEIDEIRTRGRALSLKEKTATRDFTVQQLDKAERVCLYFRVENESQFDAFAHLSDYMRRIFTIACHGQHYWFYRRQLQLGGLKSADLEEIPLPKINFEVPRWLVTEWEFDEACDENGTVSHSNPRPYTWRYHRFFDQYPNSNEAAFMLKLGIESEAARQQRDLHELVQSKDQVYFRGLFKHVDRPGTFVVQIFLADNSVFTDRKLKMPSIDTRIKLQIDPVDPSHPTPSNMKTYRGVVCEDLYNNGASFCCIVRGTEAIWGDSKTKLNPTVEQPVYISYTIDTVPHERQMMSVRRIQEIDSDRKPFGVDMKALFLADATPAPETNHLAFNTVPAELKRFEEYIDKQKPKPNHMQKLGAMDTTQSNSGITCIQGPPGCGKTDIVKVIGNAQVLLDRKVMYCAPQNEAVLNLFETFDKTAKANPGVPLNDEEYVHFTGAYQSINDAEKLKLTNELLRQDPGMSAEDAEVMVSGRNILVEYARMSLGRQSGMPEHDWTFGTKLRTMIERWASQELHVDFPNRQHSREYVKHVMKLPEVKNRDAKKEYLDYIGQLETLLGAYYLKNVVKVVFCTLSTSAHALLAANFTPDELIIDESAHESIGGIITPCGVY